MTSPLEHGQRRPASGAAAMLDRLLYHESAIEHPRRVTKPRPLDAVGPGATAVFLAVQNGNHAVRSICQATGRDVASVHRYLTLLRSRGLVDWVGGRHATIVATFRRAG